MDAIKNFPYGLSLAAASSVENLCSLLHISSCRDKLPFLPNELPTPLSTQLPTLPSFETFLSQNGLEKSLKSAYTYAFETESTALGVLTTKDSFVVLLILVLILRRIKSVLCTMFTSLGYNLAVSTHGKAWQQENNEKIVKFGEYCFRLVYHSLISIIGLYLFFNKPWWSNTPLLWTGYPHQPVSVGVTWYYLLQSAYNVDAMISLMELSFEYKLQNPFVGKNKLIQSPLSIEWSPTCRGDFREMFIHHIVTNSLVIGSSHVRITTPGSMVFLVHDISDVPVDLSKLANFMKWKTTTICCFLTMVLTWIVTRLYIIPFVYYKSVIFESPMIANLNYIDPRTYYMYCPFFHLMMISIISLHFYWFHLFIKIGYDLAFKKKLVDYSEHKDGEEKKDGKKDN